MNRLRLTWISCFLLGYAGLYSQPFRVDSIYQGSNGFVEYFPGNIPLILTATHGGDLRPASIPNRTCAGCVTSADLYTRELALELRESIFRTYGFYPHLVVNRLHRSKLDANREIIEAAQGNPEAEQAWKEFHGFVEQATHQLKTTCGRGLLIDIHGHGHTIQRLELGYLLSGVTLRTNDDNLNTEPVIQQSSIRYLASKNNLNLPHHALIRGEKSLGSLLEQEGYASVPASGDTAPKSGQDYFSGGYNTEQYGSANGGTIDAIQIECNFQGVRDNELSRAVFAERLGGALLQFMQTFYFKPLTTCQTTTSTRELAYAGKAQVVPNPGCGNFTLDSATSSWPPGTQLTLCNSIGQVFARFPTPPESLELPTNRYPNGLYWLVGQTPGTPSLKIPLWQLCTQ